MFSQAPAFWSKPDWRVAALSPVALVYGAVARRRLVTAARRQVELPVLCVGNFTVGGSGKTPVVIALALEAGRMGLKPGILSRGHGGRARKPLLVEPERDGAELVGDEPLLLARHAPVAVTPDRTAGARLLEEQGCDFVIMDDGFQSAHIHMDFALLVVDAAHGVGNGRVLPAGPLRAQIVDQLRYADAVLRLGDGHAADEVVRAASRAGRPVYDAALAPRTPDRFAGKRVLAFAGIGHPEKFFVTLRGIGADIVEARSFPDHHAFKEEEIRDLLTTARDQGLALVTTSKDAVRLGEGPASVEIRQVLEVVEVEVDFASSETPRRIISQTLEAWRRRKSSL
ncbi:tetraacyldisaccharide 4'-kinase [Pseudaminobacter sp. 19-2017]|uniref:Tetraacyldisaccharide 4'-kinase n=1 Tax=Pseudaminobacter soli (ex Zhang et al. 2022) TaxID=2831468 RepID=A0A942DYR2_9HYPH|nr:tetraacyldisaccharide 4'-kinase [Pseudaminobacter soli]